MRKLVISLFFMISGLSAALAHNGGRDSDVCHTERKIDIKHCH